MWKSVKNCKPGENKNRLSLRWRSACNEHIKRITLWISWTSFYQNLLPLNCIWQQVLSKSFVNFNNIPSNVKAQVSIAYRRYTSFFQANCIQGYAKKYFFKVANEFLKIFSFRWRHIKVIVRHGCDKTETLDPGGAYSKKAAVTDASGRKDMFVRSCCCLQSCLFFLEGERGAGYNSAGCYKNNNF